jgi:hypothetical protein
LIKTILLGAFFYPSWAILSKEIYKSRLETIKQIMLKEYFKDIFNTNKTGDATEESYYPDLKRLIENCGKKEAKSLT